MNNLRISTLSLTLVMAVITLGYVNSSSAAPKTCDEHPRPSCDGEGDGDTNLRAKFDLTIEPTPAINYIIPDGGGVYEDNSKDRVQVGTGSGPGFRFDTNTQNTSKLPRYMKARLVFMTVTGSVDDKDDIKDYEIDFRFNQTTGLDLGSLDPQVGGSCLAGDDCDGTVAASLKYFGGKQVVGFNALNNGILGFGALNASTHPDALDCLATAGKIKVTRNTSTRWTLESRPSGSKACRFAIDANGDTECTHGTAPCDGESGNFNPPLEILFKFKFTIDEQV